MVPCLIVYSIVIGVVVVGMRWVERNAARRQEAHRTASQCWSEERSHGWLTVKQL